MNNKKTENRMTMETVERQRRYVDSQKDKSKGFGIVFADAFLRGMRDLGYKNPAWAISEQSDNSFQAAATILSIRFKEDKKEKGKPEQIAVIDNGNGMIPDMISFAVRWGGTDRENDRHGFGRYGYGLPSSAVSMAKRYTVYSKVKGDEWHAVTVDLDALANAAGDPEETERLLEAKPASPPKWVIQSEDQIDVSNLDSGTIIVLEELDRLRRLKGWIKIDTIKTKFLQHFGVIYRHKIPSDLKIFVDGSLTEAVDPLFLMEHARHYDETPVVAEKVETRTVEVRVDDGSIGKVTLRASVLPPNFQLKNPSDYGKKGAARNNRFPIMRDYNGLLICREWRQIDTIQPDWTKFQNYDANIKIEINFDAVLDEYFGITTSKQQAEIEESMMEKLKHSGKDGGGLMDLIRDLRNRFEDLQSELHAKYSNGDVEEQPRSSAVAMQESEKFKDSTPELTPEQEEEARRNLEHAAEERSRITGESPEEALEKEEERAKKRRWDVKFQAIPEGPFFRPYRLGMQKVVIFNTEHPFFSKLYDAASDDVKSALEVMVFVLAERELETTGDANMFYKAERQKWSERLRRALDTLVADETMANKASAVAETLYVSQTEA